MKILSYLKKILVYVLLLALLCIRGYFAYEQRAIGDAQLQRKYTDMYERVETGYHTYASRDIHYLDLGPEDGQIVLLIHGARGSIMDRGRFLQLEDVKNSGYRFIVLDRVGYGKSGAGRIESSIEFHSNYAVDILKSLNKSDKKPIVVGHSYGGTIATKVLMDHSDAISGGVIAAGAVDPDHEVVLGISYLFAYPPLKRLMGPFLRSANDEKLSHVAALRRELNNFEDIRVPIVAIHGTADTLVPYENSLYLEENISEQYFMMITLEGEDHPMQCSNPGAIRNGLKLLR